MKRKRQRVHRAADFKRRLLCVAVASAFGGAAYANPTDPTVVNGQVSFAAQGSVLTVTNSPNAIINWQSFSIGTGETTQFVQQSSSSAVLNRVTGVDPSVILGTLSSNGQVFLINPSGILFGQGSRIDVAGLVASTLNMSNDDFLAGNLNFATGTITAGSVTNQGTITTPSGGSVILIAPQIENSGIINAPNGDVILAAGYSVRLGDTGAPNVLVEIQAPDTQAINVGEIVVGGGSASIYAGLIQQNGIVRADSVGVNEAGKIVFKATKDVTLAAGSQTSASGTNGGQILVQAEQGTNLVQGEVTAIGASGVGGGINLLGARVEVSANASVNASGTAGGGTILVGGDYKGGNADIQNASTTFFAADATLSADATDNGDGGTIILWSDQVTQAYGQISATGGANGGNGGFVETSSGGDLEVTQAPNVGQGGTWLIDPVNILVDSAFALIINTTLDSDGNVILDTNQAGTDLGNITVDAAITKSTGTTSTLTMNADGDIVINPTGSITALNGTSLVVSMDSDQDNNATGSITTFGVIDTGASGGFTADNITFLNETSHFGGLFTVSGQLELVTNAKLVFDYNKAANSAGSLVLDPNSGGGLTLESATGATFSTGTLDIIDDPRTPGAGVVIVDGLSISNSGLTTFDTHFLTFANSGALSTNDLSMSSGTIQGSGSLTVNNSFSATGGAIQLDLASSSLSISQASGDLSLSIPVQAQLVTLQSNDNLIITNNVTAGDLILAADQDLNGGDVTITPTSAPVVVDALGSIKVSGVNFNVLGGSNLAVTVTAGGDLTVGQDPADSTTLPLTGTMLVQGGSVFFSDSDASATVQASGNVFINAGSVEIRGGIANGSAFEGSVNAATANALVSAGGDVTLITTTGGLTVQGGGASAVAHSFGQASADANASLTAGQAMTLTIAGTVLVAGGDSASASASGFGFSGQPLATANANATVSAGTILTLNNAAGLTVRGGNSVSASVSDAGTNSATVEANASVLANSMNLTVAGPVVIQGGSSASANGFFSPDPNARNSASVSTNALVQTTNGLTLTVSGGDVTVAGGDFASAYASEALGQYAISVNAKAELSAGGDISINVTGGGLRIRGGDNASVYASASPITSQINASVVATGVVDAGGNLTVVAPDVTVRGGDFASISASGSDLGTLITASNNVDGRMTAGGSVTIGASTLTVRGGDGASASAFGSGQNTALITADGLLDAGTTMNLAVTGAMTVRGGNDAGASASFGSAGGGNNAQVGVDALISAGSGLTVTAGSLTVAGGIQSSFQQAFTSGSGSNFAATLANADIVSGGDLTYTGGPLTVQGGTARSQGGSGNNFSVAEANAGIQVATTKTLDITGDLNVLGGSALDTGLTPGFASASAVLDPSVGDVSASGNIIISGGTVAGNGVADAAITAGGSLSLAAGTAITVGASGSILAGTDVVLFADDLIVGGTITSGTAATDFVQYVPTATGVVLLDDSTDFTNIFTPTLRIGDSSTTNDILITGGVAINFSTFTNLSITTTGAMTQDTGTSLQLTAPNSGLQVTAGSVSLTDSGNSFANLSGSASSGDFVVNTAGTVSVGELVDGVSGVSSFGAVDVTSGGSIVISNTISGANITLNAATGISTLGGILDTSAANGAISLSGGAIGSSGSPIQVDPGTGAVSIASSGGGIYVSQTAGNLMFSNYSISSISVGQTISLTSSGDIIVDSTLSSNTTDDVFLLTATGNLFVDSVTLNAADATLLAASITIGSSGSTAASGITTTGDFSLTTGGALIVDGTANDAKLTAGGTMTISAGSVTVTGGVGSASIDPTLLNLTATGDIVLTGGSTTGAFAEIAGDSVTMSAANITLNGGTADNTYAAIAALNGDATVNAFNAIIFDPGVGTDADAVVLATGTATLTAASCVGCVTLISDPLGNSVTENGVFGANVAFGGGLSAGTPLIEVDNSIIYAASLAEEGGEANTEYTEEEEEETEETATTEGGEDDNKSKGALPACI